MYITHLQIYINLDSQQSAGILSSLIYTHFFALLMTIFHFTNLYITFSLHFGEHLEMNLNLMPITWQFGTNLKFVSQDEFENFLERKPRPVKGSSLIMFSLIFSISRPESH